MFTTLQVKKKGTASKGEGKWRGEEKMGNERMGREDKLQCIDTHLARNEETLCPTKDER